MGFFRRLAEESTKQFNEALGKLEKEINKEVTKMQQAANTPTNSSSSFPYDHNTPNYYYKPSHNDFMPNNQHNTNVGSSSSIPSHTRNNAPPEQHANSGSSNFPNHNHSNNTRNSGENQQNEDNDRMSREQEEHLSYLYNQMALNQIRRAENSMNMLGTIGTNQSYVVTMERPNYDHFSSYPSTGPISEEQHLSNLRSQLAFNQIRRAEESMTMMGTIGTNSRVEWVGRRGGFSGYGSSINSLGNIG